MIIIIMIIMIIMIMIMIMIIIMIILMIMIIIIMLSSLSLSLLLSVLSLYNGFKISAHAWKFGVSGACSVQNVCRVYKIYTVSLRVHGVHSV